MVYSKKIYGYYIPSQINHYVSNVFLNDVLRNETYFKELEDNKSPIEKRISEVLSLITNDKNKQIFVDRIVSVVEDYNKKINIYKNNLGNKLTFGVEDQYTSESKLMFELSNIENDIKLYNLNIYKFNEMYEYMNKLNKILNKEELQESEALDDFQTLVKDLVEIPLNYINDPKYFDELRNILIIDSTKVIEGIKESILYNKQVEQSFNTLEEFIFYLRSQIHPFLELVNITVDNKSLTEEIHNDILNIRNYNFEMSHNKQVENYVSLLNNVFVELNAMMDYEQRGKYEESISNILKFDIDNNKDKNSIYNELINKCHEIMRIYYDVLEENREKESVKEISLEKIKSSS